MILSLILTLSISSFAAEPQFHLKKMDDSRDVDAINVNFRGQASDLKKIKEDLDAYPAVSNVPTLDGANAFTGANSFAGANTHTGTVSVSTLTFSKSISGDFATNTLVRNLLPSGLLVYNHVTATILASFNVTSVTDSGTGKFVVNWATDMASTNYAVLCTPGTTAAVGNYMSCNVYTNDCAAAVGSTCFRTADFVGNLIDCSRVTVMAFGGAE
ncbi:MAG: hypothetical protein WC713_00890 [Candidatus Methylomirabilota bacterium]